VKLSLKIETADSMNEVTDVTSMHLKSKSGLIYPVKFYSAVDKSEVGVLITKLKKGQEIDLECVARKGIAKDHAKFGPCCVASFSYEPEITFNYN